MSEERIEIRIRGEQFLRMMELRHLPEHPVERVVKVAMLKRCHPLELLGLRGVPRAEEDRLVLTPDDIRRGRGLGGQIIQP